MHSTTITITKPSTVSLAEKEVYDSEKTLHLLLERMKKTLPLEQLAPVLKWEEQFFQRFHLQAESYEDRMKTIYVLCFLAYGLMEPTMLYTAKSKEEQGEWLQNLEAVETIIQEMLPQDKEFEAVVKAFKEKQMQYPRFVFLSRMLIKLDGLIDLLYEQANAINAKLVEDFEKIRQALLEVQKTKELSSEEVNQRFDSLTEQMLECIERLKNSFQQSQLLTKELLQQQQDRSQSLNQLENLLKRI